MKELQHISHFYFIGIGGIGMSALARYLNQQGKKVAGYDRVESNLTQNLIEEGIQVQYKDDFDGIPNAYKQLENAQVIFTPAIPQELDILLRFRESGISILKRAQMLGQISKTMTCLAIAGTHGKTTTSSILAHLLNQSGHKITAFLGGILEDYQTNYLYSGTDVMVVEADEFDRSFMQLDPDIAGITAIDADHLDIYGDVSEFEKTFRDFAGLLQGKTLLVNEKVPMDGIQVGIDRGKYRVLNLSIVNGTYHFDLQTPQGVIENCLLMLPGRHNLNNAVLAMAVALEYGADPESLRLALATFPGVARRFTYRLNTPEFILIDDYAHHPTEINAVYEAVSEMYPEEEITVIFQPHLYSRTRDFMQEFSQALAQFNNVGLLDIYPARELPIEGIDSAVLSLMISQNENPPAVVTVVDKKDLQAFVEEMGNRLVVMLGAGDIGIEIEKLTKSLSDEKV
ncbi:UDP-N-acetylmuramate--L-alanine ligase [Nonlabens xiamenensis]|uniref:UDP-N-acetylmuramate--L-alanine ligase n=1 Tax=Nonlabens xiamenensis TaxID=2341043 RepID=UPI000F6077F5|nr:UDP-N-acetylmuramate--L-alanine ligase [Nonlabens xiamenensis]